MLWRGFAIFKTSQSFDKITALTYALMDNFLSLFIPLTKGLAIKIILGMAIAKEKKKYFVFISLKSFNLVLLKN